MSAAAGATRYAGARVHRVEDARLLTGTGTYVDDVTVPGMLYACFVRSPFAHARLGTIDTTGAKALPGVRAVFTAADINPLMHEQWHTSQGPDGPETPRPPLAEGKVRFVGDPVALVVAESRYIAEDAADLIEVDYDPLPVVADYATAPSDETLVQEGHGSNLIFSIPGPPAEPVEEAFAAAANVVTEDIYQQAYTAVPMECRAILVDASSRSGDITIYSATQAPHEVRMFGARLLGIPEHRIRVIMRDTGGGFGQKIMVQRDEMCIMLSAFKLGAAVKWAEDRRENLMTAGQSRHEHCTASLAFDGDGVMEAARIDFESDCGAYPTPWPVQTAAVVGMLFPGPYRITKSTFTTSTVYTNRPGRSAYRGPWQFETLAREVLVEIAARKLGIDPVELRRKNLLRSDELPWTNANGMPYSAMTPLETFDHAVELLGYEAFRKEQAEARQEGRYLGVGMSVYVEMSTPGAGYYGSEAATIRIEPSGMVNVYINGGACGNSTETTVVQLAADALGVDIADVHTIQGDTALAGFGAGTGGSRSGSMTAGAIGQTAAILKERIVAIAAQKLEAAPEDIELANSRAFVRGTPASAVTLAEIARTAYFDAGSLPAGVEAGLEATSRYKPDVPFVWVNAAHICTCEVDVATGRVKLLRYIVGEDCGPMINPNVVEGQIAGGVVQGIGGVLLEDLAYDEDGNPLATTFMDYLLPTATEVPIIEYGHVETPSPGPGGYKGVGEGGAIGAPPAVVNALNDALAPFGVAATKLPLTPASIVALLAGASRS